MTVLDRFTEEVFQTRTSLSDGQQTVLAPSSFVYNISLILKYTANGSIVKRSFCFFLKQSFLFALVVHALFIAISLEFCDSLLLLLLAPTGGHGNYPSANDTDY